jgi:tRNA pseudouridine55 synthase
LERRRVGPLSIGQALTIDRISALAAVGTLQQHLIPMDQVLEHLPALMVAGEQVKRVLHGGAVVPARMEQLASVSAGVSVRLKDETGRLLAVGTYDAEMAGTIKVDKVLAETESRN